jgi:hypothetical protein
MFSVHCTILNHLKHLNFLDFLSSYGSSAEKYEIQMGQWADRKHSLSNVLLCHLLKESAEMYCQSCYVMCVATSLMLPAVLCSPDCLSLHISLVQ